MSSRVGAISKLLVVDLVGSLIWFPVWWYSTGLFRVSRAAARTLKFRWREYDFAIWLKNFFVPMYGQYDVTGRIVSVFMRLIVFIGRSIAYLAEAIVYLIGVIAWIGAPVAVIGMLAINATKAL